MQKLSCEDQFKIGDLELYGRRQNLELQGVPKKDENVIQVTMNLISQLGVDIREHDISITHHLPQRKHPGQM